ncbi:MAG: hypothetical protein AAF560_02085 [Acidobacteriota bacterium]
MRRIFWILAVGAVGSLVLFTVPAGRAWSQQIAQVLVANFPEIQKIEGEIIAPVPHHRMVRKLGVIVPPVARNDTGDLIAGGELAAAKFTGAMLSLQGSVRGTLGQAGNVGAILLPREEAIIEAFRKEELIQLAPEVTSVLARPEIEYFSSQIYQDVAFPLYDIYFYNSTDKPVELNLYVYLTH